MLHNRAMSKGWRNMNQAERQMVALLVDLRENHYFMSVKAEFEHEGARLEELLRLREITLRAGLGITFKIGGCEAVTDLRAARDLGVEGIVAPMVESAFAMKKFLAAVDEVYSVDELRDVGLHINVESIQGARSFPEMLEQPEFARLSGVTIGRGDLANSLGQDRNRINTDEMFRICKEIFASTKSRYPDAECILGNFPDCESFAFLDRFSPGVITGYERRKAMYHMGNGWRDSCVEGLYKGLLFEKLWCENRRSYYAALSRSDTGYLKTLDGSLERIKSHMVKS